MIDDARHSDADAPSLIADETLRAEREALNAVAQFDRVLDHIDLVERDGRPFRLRVSTIQELHRIALEGLSAYAETGDQAVSASARASTSRLPLTLSPG